MAEQPKNEPDRITQLEVQLAAFKGQAQTTTKGILEQLAAVNESIKALSKQIDEAQFIADGVFIEDAVKHDIVKSILIAYKYELEDNQTERLIKIIRALEGC